MTVLTLYTFSYCKSPGIRCEFVIRAESKQEARLIAQKEAVRLNGGWRFQGSD